MMKEFMQWVAPWVADDRTIVTVVTLLLVWSIYSGTRLWRGTAKLSNALDRVTRRLEEAPDAKSFVAQYQTISTDLAADPILGRRWREVDDSLVLPRIPGRLIHSTSRLDAWFNLSLLRVREINVDARYHAALPNLLVGAGLLFTFFGLAAALTSAGGITAGSALDRNSSLKMLLDAASAKFITSVAGLLLSIGYALFRKWRLKAVERALDRFLAAFEERVPLLTPAALQQEANDLLGRQLTSAEGFANELSIALQGAFDQAFDKRLGDHIGPLRESMDKLAAGMSSGNEDAIARMLDNFIERLQGGASDRMQGVAASLESLGVKLEGLQSGLGVAAVRMADAAESMTTRMGEGAQDALSGITAQMSGLVETLRTMAEQTRGAGMEAGRELAGRMETAAGGFEEAARNVAAALTGAASDTGGALGRGAGEAVERIAAATEGMRTEMKALIEEFRGAAASAGETLRDGGIAGAEALRATLGGAGESVSTALSDAAGRLTLAGEQAGAALARGGEAAGSRLDDAGAGFGGRAEGLARQVVALTSASDGIIVRLTEFDRAAREAASPLVATSTDLRAAGEAARGSVEPLAQAAQSVGRALDQIAGAAQRLESTQIAAERLSNTVTEAAGRFEGLDRSLAEVLSGLQTGLEGFTRQVAEVVTQTDENLAKAATQLGHLVKDLNNAIEDFTETRRAANGGPPAWNSPGLDTR